ncbi:hypothetical protein Dda_4333 [Drechslerella dactyloides]|uniref:CFEM domain-containing protein n=1 Tax=Drechslerella dactyloides TaxID=74499 RepID=A0AAD6J133_DREDA|nr:hypothetical protein Dda_4333 [Drechslerella dactyloides]
MRADPPGLPECAKPCFKPAVEATGCPQSDNACICDSQIYWQRMLSCTFMGCRFEDNAALLDFGLTFCNRKRTSTNSAQRLDGAGKPSDTSTALPSTSVAIVQPESFPSPVESVYTPPPEPLYTSPASSSSILPPTTTFAPAPAPAPSPTTFEVVYPVFSSSASELSSPSEDSPKLVATDGTSSTTLVESSTSTASPSTSTFARETTSSVEVTKVHTSSTAAVAPPPEDPTTPAVSQETPTKAVPSGQFTVEQPSSKTESSNSDILVIQTANPSTGAAKGQVTDAPARTSAPPAATADEPSSASAGALHLFNQSSFASFLLCLLALFFVF